MIATETHGEVTRVIFSTRRSRAFGYSVSAFLTRGALIDTGFPDVAADVEALLARERPRCVVLTHHHEDHAGNVAAVARRGVPVALSALTREALAEEEHAGLYRRIVWGTMAPVSLAGEGALPEGLALIHAPGHSPDHHMVWDADRETLFAGDLFLSVKVRVARPTEDPRAHVRSLRAAAALRPRVMFDSHRGRIPDPVTALTAKADWLEETLAAIDRRIADGWSDARIARELLGAEDWVGVLSAYDLSRRNLVRTARRSARAATAAAAAASGARAPAR
ncbi:MAG TPA: MBL fold metallo-hydrolase [Gemmatimonadaceae bacterium]|nr:MBL fold metallo-hydrolase [Gemmatimonadaceae bacterium]